MGCTCSVCYDDPVCDWCARQAATSVLDVRSSRFGCTDAGKMEGAGHPQWRTYDRFGRTVWVYVKDEFGSVMGREDLPPSCTAEDAF